MANLRILMYICVNVFSFLEQIRTSCPCPDYLPSKRLLDELNMGMKEKHIFYK